MLAVAVAQTDSEPVHHFIHTGHTVIRGAVDSKGLRAESESLANRDIATGCWAPERAHSACFITHAQATAIA